MIWTKVTPYLYTTNQGHKVRKVDSMYNVFLGGRFIGSSDDKEKVKALMRIKQEEQERAEEWLCCYVLPPNP